MLPWQKRREALFDLFGGMDDKAIMETDSRFQPLREAMGKLSLEDYRKKVTQQRKGFLTDRNEIPARISECEKTISDLEGIDFDGAQTELGILSARRDQLQKELLAIEQNTAVQGKQMELREARMELDKLESENQRFREDQRRQMPDTGRLEKLLQQNRNSLASAKRILDSRTAEIQRWERAIENSRQEWKSVNAETFSGSSTCPTCGQRLPEDQINRAVNAFAEGKKKRLDDLVNDSKHFKAQKSECEKEAEETRAYIASLESQVQGLELELSEAKKAASGAQIADMPDYAERKDSITNWISSIQRELDGLREDAAKSGSELRRRISEVNGKIRECSETAGKRSAYEYAKARIGKLREEAASAADNLGKLDQMLFLMDEYSRYKASFVEGSINEHFSLARFRLFREQANGGVEDRCDVVYGGVPYMGLNNGAKINVGIDIINTLSRAYGVTVPLFVDNAESVTKLEKTDCQVIRLVVSDNDKELRIDHEN